MMEVKKSIVPQIMTILLVALMILMSEVFHEKEFIFPEITALTIGAWLAPKQVWKTNKIKLVFLIAAYASLGIILVKYVDIDIYFKILIGFVVCVTGLFLSKTTFAPLISATILPIIINSESWLYPLFATAMSILIVIGQQYLEKGGYRSVQEYHPVTAAVKETYSLNLKRLCALALTAFIALQLKLPFLIAPPLIVAFVELSSNHPKLRHNSIKLAFVTFICAFSGAYGRMCWDELAKTIITRFDTPSSGVYIHPEQNRTLTPREAARIQSFDDDYIFYGNKSSVIKQIGNAVPPMLAYYLANVIKEIEKENK